MSKGKFIFSFLLFFSVFLRDYFRMLTVVLDSMESKCFSYLLQHELRTDKLIAFVWNGKSLAVVFLLLFFLFFLLVADFRWTGKIWQGKLDASTFVTLNACDQDRTCFLGYTSKYLSKCFDDCYLSSVWPVPV